MICSSLVISFCLSYLKWVSSAESNDTVHECDKYCFTYFGIHKNQTKSSLYHQDKKCCPCSKSPDLTAQDVLKIIGLALASIAMLIAIVAFHQWCKQVKCIQHRSSKIYKRPIAPIQ